MMRRRFLPWMTLNALVVSTGLLACPIAALARGPGSRIGLPAGGGRYADIELALRTGKYEAAKRLAEDRSHRTPRDLRLSILAARADQALGLDVEARRALEEAVASAPDDRPACDALMRLLARLGDRPALAPLIARSYADWNGGRIDKSKPGELRAVATAVRLDNNWKDANETLREAVLADPRAVEANLDWGWMFLEKHTASEAEASFRAVLAVDPEHPDAHVGLARAALEQRYDAATARLHLARALAVNPRHAGALALRAELALDTEDFAAAAADVAALRSTNPHDPGAAQVAGAAALLLDDAATYARERDGYRARQAGNAEFFAFVTDALTRQRRYDEARAVAEEGVAADHENARCLSALATTLLRLGDEPAGLEVLRRAWKLDPYDARTYNLLNLFEKVIPARYVTLTTAHLRFRIEPAARPAVEAVIAPFLEETYRRYVTRYGFEPRGPVTFELYGDPAHFAVRTVGLPSIGVSGVCFGRVITSLAPTNHAFNWGMVLAHELAHVFAIQLSRSRVPRWFTEGLSEVETLRARPEWARHDEVALWGAGKRGELPPLTELSNAFVNAHDAEGAVRAYAHAALAMEFLERRFGFGSIRSALVAYGRGERGPAVLERLAGMPAARLETAFRSELAARWAGYEKQYLPTQVLRRARPDGAPATAARPDRIGVAVDIPAEVGRGLAALAAGDAVTARAALARAQGARQPSIDDQAGILFLAAELALARRDADAAVSALQALLGLGPPASHDGYDVRVRLALAEVHRRNAAAAEAHLRRAVAFDETRVEPHGLLAELFAEQHRVADRLAELEAVLRLEPQNAALAKELVLGSARAGRSARVQWAAAIAVFIDPADADVHAALGRALLATGQPAAAALAFERALLFRPVDGPALHAALAEVYTKLGDARRAAAHRAAGAP
jgi:cellulose synthase operon protein C